jgi:hypothetical protein
MLLIFHTKISRSTCDDYLLDIAADWGVKEGRPCCKKVHDGKPHRAARGARWKSDADWEGKGFGSRGPPGVAACSPSTCISAATACGPW